MEELVPRRFRICENNRQYFISTTSTPVLACNSTSWCIRRLLARVRGGPSLTDGHRPATAQQRSYLVFGASGCSPASCPLLPSLPALSVPTSTLIPTSTLCISSGTPRHDTLQSTHVFLQSSAARLPTSRHATAGWFVCSCRGSAAQTIASFHSSFNLATTSRAFSHVDTAQPPPASPYI